MRPPLASHNLGGGATGDGRAILKEVLFGIEEFLVEGGGGKWRGRTGDGGGRRGGRGPVGARDGGR